MFILEYKDGVKPEKLSLKAKANMERCANFLVEMIEKYGKEILEEIEAEEQVVVEKTNKDRRTQICDPAICAIRQENEKN